MRGVILRLLNASHAYLVKAPALTANQSLTLPTGTPVANQVIQATNTNGDTAWAYPKPTRRQSVLTGRRDTALENAPANALSSNTLTVTLNASVADPFVFTIADGLIDYGPIELTSALTTTVASNTTSYIYLNRGTTGTITLGSTTVLPVYSYLAPTSPVTNQHWFDLGKFQMRLWNGATWISATRLFVGEVIATTSVQSVVTYAYQGRYHSAWTAVGSYGAYNFAHNLGAYISTGINVQVFINNVASDVGSIPAYVGDSAYGMYFSNTSAPNTRNQIEISWGQYVHLDNGIWNTNAYAKIFASKGW